MSGTELLVSPARVCCFLDAARTGRLYILITPGLNRSGISWMLQSIKRDMKQNQLLGVSSCTVLLHIEYVDWEKKITWVSGYRRPNKDIPKTFLQHYNK